MPAFYGDLFNLPVNRCNVLLTSMPKMSTGNTRAFPGVCSDHFLFHEHLRGPYHCPEQPAPMGLLVGDCDYYVNGTRNRLQQHQLFVVNRNSHLSVDVKKEASPTLLFFHSRLPDLVRHSLEHGDEVLLEESGEITYHDFCFLERIHHNAAFTQTMDTLIALGGSCSSFASLKADIMIRNLFEQLLRENISASKLSNNINAVKASTRLEVFKRVALAKEWMKANYRSRLSLDEIAVVANMNSQHFLRMFKQVYRITPHQYLIGCQLDKAKQLLKETALPVTEICHDVGFESIYSFSLLFRKRFGVPPSKARQ